MESNRHGAIDTMNKPRVVVLGAGFGGLELSTLLSETFGDGVDVTLIDKGDAFVFGYSKLDVMFGRMTLDAVRLPYRDFVKPGVRQLKNAGCTRAVLGRVPERCGLRFLGLRQPRARSNTSSSLSA
jgi:NADPH-dependent 2,4-dienoyl-CoA reductase/sulfur reductase-like enzyme